MIMVMTLVTSTTMASNINNRSWSKQNQHDVSRVEQRMQKNDHKDIQSNNQKNNQHSNMMNGCSLCNSKKNTSNKTNKCPICNKKNCKKHNFCPNCGRDLHSLSNSYGNMNRPFDSKR